MKDAELKLTNGVVLFSRLWKFNEWVLEGEDNRILPPAKYEGDEGLWEDFTSAFWETVLMGISMESPVGLKYLYDKENLIDIMLIPYHECKANFEHFTNFLLTIIPDDMTTVDHEGVNYIVFLYNE